MNSTAEILPDNVLPIPPNDQADAPSEIAPFTVWTVDELFAYEEPPGLHYLLPAYVTKGELTVAMGQGGIGKSRLFGVWLPICQITGLGWCDLQTGGEPQDWLYIGNENSITRQRDDLKKILPNLDPVNQQLVKKHFKFHVLKDLNDYMMLLDLEGKARLAKTLAIHKPGGIVVDPFGNLIEGDINKMADVKKTLRDLLAIVRENTPQAAVVLLHHARTGRSNILQGVGYDAANFGLGSKALYSAARCQINLMPGDAEDSSKLVLSCAKANNCEQFSTRGLDFDPGTFCYSVDPHFDLKAWIADVEGKQKRSACTLRDVVHAVKEGFIKTADIVEHLKEITGASVPTIKRRLCEAREKHALEVLGQKGVYSLGKTAGQILGLGGGSVEFEPET